jgi:hypothetical protein
MSELTDKQRKNRWRRLEQLREKCNNSSLSARFRLLALCREFVRDHEPSGWMGTYTYEEYVKPMRKLLKEINNEETKAAQDHGARD